MKSKHFLCSICLSSLPLCSHSIYNGIDSISNSVQLSWEMHTQTCKHQKKIYDTNSDDGKKKTRRKKERKKICLDVVDAPKKNCLFVKCQWFRIVHPIGIQIYSMFHFPQESFCHWHLYDRCKCSVQREWGKEGVRERERGRVCVYAYVYVSMSMYFFQLETELTPVKSISSNI